MPTGHLIWIVIVTIFVAMALWRLSSRPTEQTAAAILDAIERVKSGEKGVRILPPSRPYDTRLVNRFNAVLAEVEAGTFDWDRAEPREAAMFSALRRNDHASCEEFGTTFVAVAEIERFTALRQSIGYKLANQLLAAVAQRILASIPHAEPGRMGRTTIEFAFKARSSGEAQLRLLAALETIEKRLFIEDYSFDLPVIIGFADAGSSSIRDELVDQAAAAVSAAQAQRVKVCFAGPDLIQDNGRGDLELMRALPGALRDGEVQLHYQPKLQARTNTITSAEALVRWTRPGLGLVPTDRFIAVAEEMGAIRELTEWVIARAIRDQKRLMEQGHELEIYVNISAQLLPDGDFAQAALALVEGAQGKIGFEITETAVIDDPDAALANLDRFTQAGIRIAIDDYGTGLSSLAYLKQLPAHELKIDRMFIAGLTQSHRDPLLVRSSIDLAHALEMEVTAEGVEDPMTLSLLRVMGCDLLQGYFISRPIPLESLTAFLADASALTHLTAPQESGHWPRFGNG